MDSGSVLDSARMKYDRIDSSLRLSDSSKMTFEHYLRELILLEFSGVPQADAIKRVDDLVHGYSVAVGGEINGKRVALHRAFRDRDRGGELDTVLTIPINDKLADMCR